MEKTKKFWHKEFWTKGKLIKWSVIGVIFIALVIGFWHEHYIHTEGFIKQRLLDNKTLFTEVADNLMDNSTTGKVNTKTLKSDATHSDILTQVEKLESIGISDISGSSDKVQFYSLYRYSLIYTADGSTPSNSKELGDGWYYISTE